MIRTWQGLDPRKGGINLILFGLNSINVLLNFKHENKSKFITGTLREMK